MKGVDEGEDEERTRKALEEKREDDRMIGATDEGHV
jgi:hypothetical protein